MRNAECRMRNGRKQFRDKKEREKMRRHSGFRSAPAYARGLRRAGLPAGRQGLRNGKRREDAPLYRLGPLARWGTRAQFYEEMRKTQNQIWKPISHTNKVLIQNSLIRGVWLKIRYFYRKNTRFTAFTFLPIWKKIHNKDRDVSQSRE